MLSRVFKGKLLILHVFLTFLSVDTDVNAQIDSLLIAPLKEKKSLTYGLNNRRTYLLGDPSTIYGVYFGIQYGERLKHVITYNNNLFWAGNNEQVRVQFLGFAEEYTFYSVGRFEFVSYIHIGVGFASYRNLTLLHEHQFYDELISPVELGVHGSLRIYDWLKFKTGAGYRFVLLDKEHDMDGFYYKIGASLAVGTIWNSFQNKKANH